RLRDKINKTGLMFSALWEAVGIGLLRPVGAAVINPEMLDRIPALKNLYATKPTAFMLRATTHEAAKNTEKATVSSGGKTVAEFTLKYGGITFPVSTKLLPFPLVQDYDGKYYFTNFFGKGKGKIARIKEIKINPEFFPDVSAIKPIAVIRVSPFSITFPIAKIKEK
ncbi:MAG: hypothetical protein MJ072_03100, partial [Clostridia bacterium]|nr:hypothetical protein [Clostridia bacterium]